MRRVLIAVLELALVLVTATLGLLTFAGFVDTVKAFDWVKVPFVVLIVGLTALSFRAWRKLARRRVAKRGGPSKVKPAVLAFMVTWVLPGLLVAGMLVALWMGRYSLYALPRTYDRLERSGVRVSATLGYVNPPGIDRFKDNDYYTLTYAFGGRERTKNVFEHWDQFDGVPLGQTVPMLVDPKDPDTAFSVADVRARTNAGFGLLSGVSLLLFVMCLYYLFDPVSRRLSRGTGR
jgi:hypothetical protein